MRFVFVDSIPSMCVLLTEHRSVETRRTLVKGSKRQRESSASRVKALQRSIFFSVPYELLEKLPIVACLAAYQIQLWLDRFTKQ